jgi:WhiB family redox-sensing transcriptional regulator
MTPMHWPGTTAVMEHAAGLKAGSAAAALNTESQAPAAADALAVAGLPSDLGLPCSDDPELFFAEAPEDVEYAKSLCRGCPAQLTCLAGAIERKEPWGVWGGELFLRGEFVPRKRPRGRPRKTDVAA